MSRIKQLKEQNPILSMSFIDMLATIDPSKTNKYLDFLIRMIKTNYGDSNNNDFLIENIMSTVFGQSNLSTLREFDEHNSANRIKNNDISKFTTFHDLALEVEKAKEILKQKEIEKQVKKLYSDDDWLVLIPLSYEASAKYGSGTKWCTTQEIHWNTYRLNYKLIYIIGKNEKYAISLSTNGDNIQGWLENDDEINPLLLNIPLNILGIIIEENNKNEAIIDLDPNYTPAPKLNRRTRRVTREVTRNGNEYLLYDEEEYDEEIQEQVDTLNNQIRENLICDTDLNAYIRLLLPNYSSYLDNRY